MAVVADFIVAGTGSRSLRVADRPVQVAAMEVVTERVARLVLEHDERLVVMSGGAEGFDELLARVALKLGVRLWLALPSKTYLDYYWRRNSLLGYDRGDEARQILDAAEKVTYVAEGILGTKQLKVDGLHVNFHRNFWMVDTADDWLALGPVKPGSGTAQCVEAIRAAGRWRDEMLVSLPSRT